MRIRDKKRLQPRHVNHQRQRRLRLGAEKQAVVQDIRTARKLRPRTVERSLGRPKTAKDALFFATGLALLAIWVVFFGRFNSKVNYDGAYGNEVQAAVDRYFSNTSRWRFSFDSDIFARTIQRENPLFENVIVQTSPWSRVIHLQATTKPAVLVWQSGGRRFGLDREGYIVSSEVDAKSPLVTIFDAAQLDYGIGQKIVTSDFLQFIGSLQRAAATRKITITSISLTESIQSLRLRLKGVDYELRVSTVIDPAAQLTTYKDLISSTLFAGRGAPQDYVDTQVAGRIFWR